jgi:hypothetical protein
MANPSSGKSDADIIGEVRQMYHSPLVVHVREAHKRGVPATVKIGSYNIQYERYQFSGMTAFPDGFVIGKEALAAMWQWSAFVAPKVTPNYGKGERPLAFD